MKYRHPDGRLIEATEEKYETTWRAQGFEPEPGPDLEKLTRDELNAHAAEAGVSDPEALPNKAAVIDAIEGDHTPVESKGE